jgi:hypothetical protein
MSSNPSTTKNRERERGRREEKRRGEEREEGERELLGGFFWVKKYEFVGLCYGLPSLFPGGRYEGQKACVRP